MKARWVAVALALGALALVACGDDNDSDGDLAAFCEANATINRADPFAAASADEAEQIADEMRGAFETGQSAAPDEVADDVAIVAGVFGRMLDELEAASYEPGAVDPNALFAEAVEADAEFEPALERVGTFAEEEC